MERELAAHLLSVARTFAQAKGLSLTTIGRKAAWDGRFFDNLVDPSKSFTARKYDEVLAYFSANWPEDGLTWPPHIARPDRGAWAGIEARAKARAQAKRTAASLNASAAA